MPVTGSRIIVPGAGRVPCDYMIVGEAPGETEARRGQPFVGRAGKEQERYLINEGMHPSQFYRTNVVKLFIEGNPDPTPELIAEWSGELVTEIRRVRPRFILAVGRFSTRWFLGDHVDMDEVHGRPHRISKISPAYGCSDAIIIPCYHPAYGFYDDEARTLIAYDYGQAVGIIKGRLSSEPVVDELEGREVYEDVAGWELDDIIATYDEDVTFAFDTEGTPGDEWSIQVSFEPGTGYVLRRSRPDFALGIVAIRNRVYHHASPIVVVHNLMYDYEMTVGMGLDLFDANVFDTRYAAYIMRVEPQGLKFLAPRWTGMEMREYADVVGPVGLEKQLNYLATVVDMADEWPEPETRVEYENDGTFAPYTPQPIAKLALKIVSDFASGKRDKDGNLPDPMARWRNLDHVQRRAVERKLGPMPVGTLADIPLAEAIRYAARDPDATLRTFYPLVRKLAKSNLTQLMADGCAVLPIFEEMQRSGMLADRDYMLRKADEMWAHMMKIGARISTRYWDNRPFNPASSDQVATLMRRQGLYGEKRSKKTGKVSTAKKSIEHLRYKNDAMAAVIDWREHQKMRDAFYRPIAERCGDDRFKRIRTHLNPYKVATRRISSSDPNLTAIPVRNELGKDVRDGFSAEEGCMLGSWDLSQIEMRYMAHISRDPLLVQFFNDPRLDVHCETAARIFGLKVYRDAPSKDEMYAEIKEMEHRYPSKRAGFGIITNIQGPGLLDQLRMFGCQGWDEDKCDDLIAEWLRVYRGVATFLDECRREVQQRGYVRDCWGMPRYLPGVWSDDGKVRGEAERAASSHKIQGGAQGMLQRAMIWIKPYIRGLQQAGARVRWILQIHDEVIIEFEEDLWETIDPIVREGLTEHGLKLIVPVKCSGSKAKTWGKLK